MESGYQMGVRDDRKRLWEEVRRLMGFGTGSPRMVVLTISDTEDKVRTPLLDANTRL